MQHEEYVCMYSQKVLNSIRFDFLGPSLLIIVVAALIYRLMLVWCTEGVRYIYAALGMERYVSR